MYISVKTLSNLVKKCPMLTTARHPPVSCAISIHYMSSHSYLFRIHCNVTLPSDFMVFELVSFV